MARFLTSVRNSAQPQTTEVPVMNVKNVVGLSELDIEAVTKPIHEIKELWIAEVASGISEEAIKGIALHGYGHVAEGLSEISAT